MEWSEISNYLQHRGHQAINVDNCGQIDFLRKSIVDPALQEAMSLLQVEEKVLQVEGSWVGQCLGLQSLSCQPHYTGGHSP